jgi:hypothetical protein
MSNNTQNDVFLGAFNGFLAGAPCLGCRKVDFWFLSGYGWVGHTKPKKCGASSATGSTPIRL